MTIPQHTLEAVGNDILRELRNLPAEQVKSLISMSDYHGFWKSRLPVSFLRKVLTPYQLDPADAQIEIVMVDSDLTNEVHYHQVAHAVIFALGQHEGLDEAKAAMAYEGGAWRPIASGEMLDIPPGTPHGFTVGEDGELWFLSVQAPPIVGEHVDDYHRTP